MLVGFGGFGGTFRGRVRKMLRRRHTPLVWTSTGLLPGEAIHCVDRSFIAA